MEKVLGCEGFGTECKWDIGELIHVFGCEGDVRTRIGIGVRKFKLFTLK